MDKEIFFPIRISSFKHILDGNLSLSNHSSKKAHFNESFGLPSGIYRKTG